MSTEVNSNAGLTIIPESLSKVKIIPDNYLTKGISSYSFSFVLTNGVSQTSRLKIVFPKEI